MEVAPAGADAGDGRRQIARLADEMLPLLIARLEASTLGELEVREDGWRVRLRRPLHLNGTGAGDEPLPTDRVMDAPRSQGGATGTVQQPADARAAPPRGERQRTQVTSPAVGYFVPRDGLMPGTSLRNGDAIGHVDVLGVRQEVVAPVDGRLSRLEVEGGQAVEYGQTIARLERDARDSRG